MVILLLHMSSDYRETFMKHIGRGGVTMYILVVKLSFLVYNINDRG